MYLTDITNHLNWYRGIFHTIISSVINLLKSFEFNGINLFTYILALAILGVVLRAILVHYSPSVTSSVVGAKRDEDYYQSRRGE